MPSLKLLKRIVDQKDRDIVFGWIRQFLTKHNENLSTPDMMCYLCLKFYFIQIEYFTKCGKRMQIATVGDGDDYNNSIKGPGTAYGYQVIDGNNRNITKYAWKIRFCFTEYQSYSSIGYDDHIDFGIDSSNKRWRGSKFNNQHIKHQKY